jgi:hypothetical protein
MSDVENVENAGASINIESTYIHPFPPPWYSNLNAGGPATFFMST